MDMYNKTFVIRFNLRNHCQQSDGTWVFHFQKTKRVVPNSAVEMHVLDLNEFFSEENLLKSEVYDMNINVLKPELHES